MVIVMVVCKNLDIYCYVPKQRRILKHSATAAVDTGWLFSLI
jgi:chemotaxis methyl-accepting protein methylase